MLKENPIFEV